MPTTTNIDDRGFIRVTLSGSWPTLAELRGLRKTLDAADRGQSVLADIRDVTEQFPYYDQIRAAIDRVKDSKPAATRRRAVIVGSEVQFGIARAFQSLLPGEVEVFRDEGAALIWLLGAGPKQPG
jgi:hypothetical protein